MFPSPISAAPFAWETLAGDRRAMRFLGGFVGTAVDDAGAIQPKLGWGIEQTG